MPAYFREVLVVREQYKLILYRMLRNDQVR